MQKTSLDKSSLSKGTYAKQFDIPVLLSNKTFVTQPYRQTKNPNDIINFSLTRGADSINSDKTKMLGYDVQGKLVYYPASPDFKSRN